ncbi:Hypothetical protein SCF082_LOCUS45767 [Durusdinium trenchii]|uniref:Uncharacterized protein n=1 Tax=Durusdinium trenchii TaxID=1381693 RepID=A0ABP0RAH3_9DINO
MNRIRQEIPSGAKMQNYSVVNWYAYSGGYPSWGSENGVSVDYSTMPPVGAIHDAHSMDSYAFCEMANAILSQTNSQFFNSCGPTAVLAALTARSPVQAFKKALQLYYTGALPGMSEACPYVYEQQPGLVPFRPDQPGGDRYHGNLWCPVEDVQSKQFLIDGQCQAVGLQRMWVTAMIGSLEHEVQLAANGDDQCEKILTSVYPGEVMTLFDDGDLIFRTPPSHIVWICEKVGRSNCSYATTFVGDCSKIFPESACTVLLDTKWSAKDLLIVQNTLQTPGQPLDAMYSLASKPTFQPILSAAPGDTTFDKFQAIARMFLMVMSVSHQDPQATANMWVKLCTAKAAVLNIAFAGLRNESSSSCSHWVFLDACRDTHYVVWSEGFRRYITKEAMHGSTCGGVVYS